MSDTSGIIPGWYENPDAPGTIRWWDGTAWTDHVTEHAGAAGDARGHGDNGAVPVTSSVTSTTATPFAGTTTGVDPTGYSTAPSAAIPARAPAGPYTIWIWLLVANPIVAIIALATFDAHAYARGTNGAGIAALIACNLGLYLLTVLFAALDQRQLRRNGIPKPFAFWWTFLYNGIYIIGRTAIVKWHTGKGLWPVWIWIGLGIVMLAVGAAQFLFVLGAAIGSST